RPTASTCSGADVMDANVWLPVLVLGLPFASFVLLAVVAPLRRAGGAAGAVSIAAIAAAFLVAVLVWGEGLGSEATWSWIPADEGPTATVGVLDHQARRPRLRHRDRDAVVRDGHVRVPRAVREGAGARAGDRGARDDHVPRLPGRGGQVRPVPPARVAPGRDGGAHPRVRAD